MIVKCNTRCWDAKTCKRYYPGDQDNIDPLDPIAAYFDFPPGTEVYCKIRGKGRVGEPIITTRIVPGLPAKPEQKDESPEVEHKRPGRPPKKDAETDPDILLK